MDKSKLSDWKSGAVLGDYGISPETGFMLRSMSSDERPPENVVWRDFLRKLPDIIEQGDVRVQIRSELGDKNFDLSVFDLDVKPVDTRIKMAFRDLSVLAQAWVHGEGGDKTTNILPAFIAHPLVALAEAIGVPPIAGYSEVILSNGRINRPENRGDMEIVPPLNLDEVQPDDFDVNRVFTSQKDEAWFYKVHMAVEVSGARTLRAMTNIIGILHDEAVDDSSKSQDITDALHDMRRSILVMRRNMERMNDECAPEYFFRTLRPFVDGTKDLGPDSDGRNGLIYEGTSDTKPRLFRGGSGAQTPIFAAMDGFFGVKHEQPKVKAFLEEIRGFYPEGHRDFIADLSDNSDLLREFVNANGHQIFDAVVAEFAKFRSSHIDVVGTYVSDEAKSLKKQLGFADGLMKGEKGTGGSDFDELLKDMRDNTNNARIGHKRSEIELE